MSSAAPSSDRPALPWWRDRDQRTRVVVVTFAALALLSMLFTAFVVLSRGDTRVLVVTMQQGAGQELRDALKQACGSLPGVTVVPDKGNPSPRIQGRFPVRFGLSGATARQESALYDCVNRQSGVRGFLVEGSD